MTASPSAADRKGSGAVGKGAPCRRRRFERSPSPARPLTPAKLEALRLLAESRFLSTEQVGRIAGWSGKVTRSHLRDLFDLSLTDRMPVPGATIGQKALLSSNVHFPTQQGLKRLEQMGLLADAGRAPTGYRPSAYLAHGLAVRDFLAWLAESSRMYDGHGIKRWDCSEANAAFGIVADAGFAYGIGEGRGSVLYGLLEADTGSERSVSGGSGDRWGSKIEAYSRLFSDDEEAVQTRRDLTGGSRHVRLLVTVPDTERARWVRRRLEGTTVTAVTWIAVRSEMAGRGVHDPAWIGPSGGMEPLLARQRQ